MKNFYHILGLSFESNPEPQLINAAYKALVKIYHPDLFKGDKKALNRKITELNQAYEILSDIEKKKKYDEQLKKFHIDKSFEYSEEEFEDKDIFDSKFINDDWEIALLVYPELEKKKNMLLKYSQKLAFQFQFYLLETKEFYKFDTISERFINAFLERKFGTSNEIKSFSKILIENGYRKNAIYLNRLVKVIGSKSEKRIIKTFLKQFPDLEEFIEEQRKFIKKFNVSSEYKSNENLFVFILIAILFLFFITLIKN